MAVDGAGGKGNGAWNLFSGVRKFGRMISGQGRLDLASADGAGRAAQAGEAVPVLGAQEGAGVFRPADSAGWPVWLSVMRDMMRDANYSAGADLGPRGSMRDSLVPEKVCGVSWGTTMADMPSSDFVLNQAELYDSVALRAGGALVTFLKGPNGTIYSDHDPETGEALDSYVPLDPAMVQHLRGTIAGFQHRIGDANAELARIAPDLAKSVAEWRSAAADDAEAGRATVYPPITEPSGLALRLKRAADNASHVRKALQHSPP